jgi:hypothetical protein
VCNVEKVGNEVPWRVQVFGGINCPLSSSPVYVSQNCVESTRPPNVSVQHESTKLGQTLGESELRKSQLGERTTGLRERSRTAPAALRTMKIRFGRSDLSCEGHTQDTGVVKAGLIVQRGQRRSSQHHSHERNRELHLRLRSLRVQSGSRKGNGKNQ